MYLRTIWLSHVFPLCLLSFAFIEDGWILNHFGFPWFELWKVVFVSYLKSFPTSALITLLSLNFPSYNPEKFETFENKVWAMFAFDEVNWTGYTSLNKSLPIIQISPHPKDQWHAYFNESPASFLTFIFLSSFIQIFFNLFTTFILLFLRVYIFLHNIYLLKTNCECN